MFTRLPGLRPRIISVVVLISFLVAEMAYATPPSNSLIKAPINPSIQSYDLDEAVKDPSQLDIPFEYCTVKEIYKGNSDKLIIHIQDAHANLSGQQNLSKILDHLMSRYDIATVLVEGSSIDATLSDVRDKMPKRDIKIAAKQLLYFGIISGEEYLNLTTEHNMKILGIENQKLYDENLLAYRDIVQVRDKALNYIHTIKKSLERIKKQLYPGTLLEYEHSTLSRAVTPPPGNNPAENMDQLFKLADSVHIHLNDAFIELSKLKELQNDESNIDFQKANTEQVELFSKLSLKGLSGVIKSFRNLSGQNRNSQISQYLLIESLLNLAKQNSVALISYPELLKYRKYLQKFSKIDSEQLLDEIEVLENEIYEKLLPNDDSKKLRAIDRFIALLEKAYKIQMTSKEFQLYTLNNESFAIPSVLAFLNLKLAELKYFDDIIPYDEVLDNTQAQIIQFYDVVNQRDLAFIDNSLKHMNDDTLNTAFLVSGGYHTQHITKLLKENNISFITLNPIITQETNHQNYEKLLLLGLKGLNITPQKVMNAVRPGAAVKWAGVRVSQYITDGVPINEHVFRLADYISQQAGSRLPPQSRPQPRTKEGKAHAQTPDESSPEESGEMAGDENKFVEGLRTGEPAKNALLEAEKLKNIKGHDTGAQKARHDILVILNNSLSGLDSSEKQTVLQRALTTIHYMNVASYSEEVRGAAERTKRALFDLLRSAGEPQYIFSSVLQILSGIQTSSPRAFLNQRSIVCLEIVDLLVSHVDEQDVLPMDDLEPYLDSMIEEVKESHERRDVNQLFLWIERNFYDALTTFAFRLSAQSKKKLTELVFGSIHHMPYVGEEGTTYQTAIELERALSYFLVSLRDAVPIERILKELDDLSYGDDRSNQKIAVLTYALRYDLRSYRGWVHLAPYEERIYESLVRKVREARDAEDSGTSRKTSFLKALHGVVSALNEGGEAFPSTVGPLLIDVIRGLSFPSDFFETLSSNSFIQWDYPKEGMPGEYMALLWRDIAGFLYGKPYASYVTKLESVLREPGHPIGVYQALMRVLRIAGLNTKRPDHGKLAGELQWDDLREWVERDEEGFMRFAENYERQADPRVSFQSMVQIYRHPSLSGAVSRLNSDQDGGIKWNLALSTALNLKRLGYAITDENVDKMLGLLSRQWEVRHADTVAGQNVTHVTHVAHEEDLFNPKHLEQINSLAQSGPERKDIFRGAGVLQSQHVDSGDWDGILKSISESRGKSIVTFSVHGNPHGLYLTDDSRIAPDMLAGAFLERWKKTNQPLTDVSVLIYACNAYSFAENFINEMVQMGLESMPSIFTVGHKHTRPKGPQDLAVLLWNVRGKPRLTFEDMHRALVSSGKQISDMGALFFHVPRKEIVQAMGEPDLESVPSNPDEAAYAWEGLGRDAPVLVFGSRISGSFDERDLQLRGVKQTPNELSQEASRERIEGKDYLLAQPLPHTQITGISPLNAARLSFVPGIKGTFIQDDQDPALFAQVAVENSIPYVLNRSGSRSAVSVDPELTAKIRRDRYRTNDENASLTFDEISVERRFNTAYAAFLEGLEIWQSLSEDGAVPVEFVIDTGSISDSLLGNLNLLYALQSDSRFKEMISQTLIGGPNEHENINALRLLADSGQIEGLDTGFKSYINSLTVIDLDTVVQRYEEDRETERRLVFAGLPKTYGDKLSKNRSITPSRKAGKGELLDLMNMTVSSGILAQWANLSDEDKAIHQERVGRYFRRVFPTMRGTAEEIDDLAQSSNRNIAWYNRISLLPLGKFIEHIFKKFDPGIRKAIQAAA